jgi:hypothetical protein
MRINKRWSLFTICGLLLTTSPSHAEQSTNDEGDQHIEFKDADSLSAEAFGLLGDKLIINVRPPKATLIRPRVSFVDALYKSVEHI